MNHPHKTSAEIRSFLHEYSLEKIWETLTPLGRNEYLCWIGSAKQEVTHLKRLHRLKSDLLSGKRRPCCWPGCPHREKNGT